MSEPKKETVRIVLPPRREGQPLASTPRETAMINLPPKPVPASSDAPTPPSAPAVPPSMPAPPANFQPPSAPGVPKPPGFPGGAAAPKPPGVPPSAPAIPKPASVPPSVAKPASTVMLKQPPSAGPTPVAVKPEAKKETAKIGSGIAMKPQATVRLQPRPQPSQAASASFKVQSAEIVPASETPEEEIPMNLSIAAVVAAVIALALQVWIMTS